MAKARAAVKVRDSAFAKRLDKACDGHAHVPAYGQGRQTWIRAQLGVSVEAVRKWFSGEARPRPELMKRLANLLEVDEAWLSLGINPEVDPKERRARNAEADGAVNVLAGFIQMNGGHPAFPSDSDQRASYVDLYAIIRGSQFAMHVSLAQQSSEGVYVFRVPPEFGECTVIGVIHLYPLRCVFIHMTQELIQKHKVRRGGCFEVTVQKVNGEFQTGDDKWPRIQSFAERL